MIPYLPNLDNFDILRKNEIDQGDVNLLADTLGKKHKKIVCAVLNKTGSYQPILLIFNSKNMVTQGYIISKFERNWTKITAVRVPHSKNVKWPA